MIDFLKYRTFGLFLFLAMVTTFVTVYSYWTYTYGQAFSYSIEFTGGTQILIRSSQPISGNAAMAVLDKGGIRSLARELSSRELLIRVQLFDEQVSSVAQEVQKQLSAANPDVTFEVLQVESVGAGVGADMWRNFLKAVIACLIAILIYIFFRFLSIGYAIGAVGALFHDALVIGTVCLLFGYEISPSIVMAILLVLGYSINDTIIIFARIRENVTTLRGKSFYDIVNISINETMRRTLLTTLSTLLPVVSLLIFGGVQFRALSVMLLIGFIFGTYSSIYIASPLMMLCTKGRQ